MVGGGNLYHKVRRGREIIVQEERLNLYSCPMEPLMLTISITLLTKALLLISITWYKLQGLQNGNCMQQCHNKPHVRLHVVTHAHRALLPSAAYAHGATMLICCAGSSCEGGDSNQWLSLQCKTLHEHQRDFSI